MLQGQIPLALQNYSGTKPLSLKFKNPIPFRNRHTYLHKLIDAQEMKSFYRTSFYFAKNLLLTVVKNIPKNMMLR